MIPSWLHNLAMGYLLLGGVCACVIGWDLIRSPQHMWIMNVVWPVTALFGTGWILWQYFQYGRLASRESVQAARSHQEPPNRKRTPFAVMGGERHVVTDSVEFWFMMQIAMLCGFVTSYPVNWWLIHRGIKEKM